MTWPSAKPTSNKTFFPKASTPVSVQSKTGTSVPV